MGQSLFLTTLHLVHPPTCFPTDPVNLSSPSTPATIHPPTPRPQQSSHARHRATRWPPVLSPLPTTPLLSTPQPFLPLGLPTPRAHIVTHLSTPHPLTARPLTRLATHPTNQPPSGRPQGHLYILVPSCPPPPFLSAALDHCPVGICLSITPHTTRLPSKPPPMPHLSTSPSHSPHTEQPLKPGPLSPWGADLERT